MPKHVEREIFAPPQARAEFIAVCCECGKTSKETKLAMHRRLDEDFITCRHGPCFKKQRQKRRYDSDAHAQIHLTPEEIAERCEFLRRSKKPPSANSIRRHLLTGDAHVSNRHHQVLLFRLGGLEATEIAAVMGYRDPETVRRILKRPEIAEAIRKVEAAQMERIISGEFGVQAAAKANASKAMARIITEVDHADRSSDKLKAAELNLKISGDLVEKKVSMHLHSLVRSFSAEELKEFVDHDRWPERLRPLIEKLGLPAPS